MSKRREDLTGMKFGRLTVIDFYDHNKYGQLRWLCECECGKTSIVTGSDLRNAKTLSCGCLRRERIVAAKTTHGMSQSSIYAEYRNMNNRCYDENAHNYKWYGGRGIRVCDRWRDSIRNFYDDVSALPNFGEKDYTLDRIDNNGNYEPANVRWATHSEQCNNRSSNLIYEYNGEMHTLQEISNMIGVPYKVLHKRIRIRGWDPERAFNTPVRKTSRV